MMVGGIVMTSLSPLALFAAAVASLRQDACEGLFDARADTDCSRYDKSIYGGLLVAGSLLAVGVPMIVIGGKKEPAGSAAIGPWLSTRSAGIGLRVDL
jgi:hypothetical protein